MGYVFSSSCLSIRCLLPLFVSSPLLWVSGAYYWSVSFVQLLISLSLAGLINHIFFFASIAVYVVPIVLSWALWHILITKQDVNCHSTMSSVRSKIIIYQGWFLLACHSPELGLGISNSFWVNGRTVLVHAIEVRFS